MNAVAKRPRNASVRTRAIRLIFELDQQVNQGTLSPEDRKIKSEILKALVKLVPPFRYKRRERSEADKKADILSEAKTKFN